MGLTFARKDARAVAKPVERSGDQVLVADDVDQLGEREAGGDDRQTPPPASGEQVEERLAAGPVAGATPSWVTISRATCLYRCFGRVSMRSSRASIGSRTTSVPRTKATLWQHSGASTSSAIATWVSPV